jgi:hypothetical protein
MPTRACLPALLLVTACTAETFHARGGQTLPPVADRALLVAPDEAKAIAGHATLIGTIDSAGGATQGQVDLADRAAVLAANRGGTHLEVAQSGEAESTYTTPASSTTTCTDDTDNSTCTTTDTPEETNTVVTPYATYNVYRVDPGAWAALPGDLQPAVYDPAHHSSTRTDGPGFAFGGFTAAFPGPTSGTNGSVFPTAYTEQAGGGDGVWLSGSWEHGSNAFALDLRFGGASASGTVMSDASGGQPIPYTMSYMVASLGLRAGKRVAWKNLALAAGVGATATLWGPVGLPSLAPDAPSPFVEPPESPIGDLALPLWTELTIKTGCSWGVQGLASYDVRPFDMAASAPSFAVGMIWQPATACR